MADVASKVAVLAVSKVLNLKANHNSPMCLTTLRQAVLAVSKVLNLKANHNHLYDNATAIELY